MKKSIFVLSALSLCIVFANSNSMASLNEKKALEFAEKYRLADLNKNEKDLSYLDDFAEKAEQKLRESFETKARSEAVEQNYEHLKNFDNEKIKQYESLKSTDIDTRKKAIGEEDSTKQEYNEEISISPEVSSEEIIIVESPEVAKEIEEIENIKNKEIKEKDSFISTLKAQTNSLSNNEVLQGNLDKVIEDNKSYNETQQTFFFFTSSDLDISNFNNFIESVDKLHRQGYNVIGRVIFLGLIDGSFDGMANWLESKKRDFGLKSSPNIKYQFHPWAFEFFSVNRIPAFALSNCKKDFRFRTCDNKYLIKGNIEFLDFIEVLADNNKDYNKMYFDLVEVEHEK